jgi:hypothetical protein
MNVNLKLNPEDTVIIELVMFNEVSTGALDKVPVLV